MDENINTEIESDLDDEIDDTIEAVEPEVDVNEVMSEIDFEYDENGDIVIPEIDDEQEENADIIAEQNTSMADSTDSVDTASPLKEKADFENTQSDEKDREIFALKAQLSALEKQSKDTLAKLGVDNKDAMSGLIKLAAEAEEISPEEYVRRKQEEERNDEARRFLQASQFQKKITADLAEVHAAFPETKVYDHVKKFPNFKRFAEFRDLGLSPKEAYIAANPDTVRASVATATKKQSLNETKSHLKPVISKESKDNSITISRKEMAEYRELFPTMSDKEIMSLYRQTKKK